MISMYGVLWKHMTDQSWQLRSEIYENIFQAKRLRDSILSTIDFDGIACDAKIVELRVL